MCSCYNDDDYIEQEQIMPVYEYVCQKCDSRTELLRKMDDADAPAQCEQCGSRKVGRVHSVFNASGVSTPSPSRAPASGHRHGLGCGHCGDPRGSCSF